MRVISLRRYPVKSCGGESLEDVAVDGRGLVGDRGWAVVDTDGKLASGKDSRRFRRMDPIFGLTARLPRDDADPEVLFPGAAEWTPVRAPAADGQLAAHLGTPVGFRPEGEVSHMDAGRVSLVGTASLAALPGPAVDPRHLRVNIVIDTDTPWVEETWLEREVRVGDVVLRPVARIPRCRMVDIAQDGVAERPGLLKTLGRERDLRLAVYADVVVPGRITLGAPVLV